MYAQADAALVGVLEARQSATTYVFRVDEDFKAELPARIEVRLDRLEEANDLECWSKARIGQRLGLLLTRDGDVWRPWSSFMGCSVMPPDTLRAAAAGLPRPNGRGPVALLVGGSFGAARVQALDARGRTLAYGSGRGETLGLEVCPGAKTFLELMYERRVPSLVFRELSTLRVRHELRLRLRGPAGPGPIHCADGAHQLAFFYATSNVDGRGRILRVQGSGVRPVARGAGWGVAFHGRFAYVVKANSVIRLDLTTGRQKRVIARDLGFDSLTVSPDGRRLAFIDNPRLGVFDLARRTLVLRPIRVGADARRWGANGSLVWVRDRVAYLPRQGEPGGARIYDVAGRQVARIPNWAGGEAANRGDRLYGLLDGSLYVSKVPRPRRRIRHFLSPITIAVAAVDRGPTIRLAGTLPCARG